MSWSFSIGRLFGSEVRVHATFFLLLLWIGVAAYINKGLQAAVVNVLFVIALFVCVIAHEYGHALMARRFGIKTPDITLLPIGGMSRLERMPEDPRQEIAVALAGPLVSLAIWAVLALTLGTTGISTLQQIDITSGRSFLAHLAAINLFLALFNLLPAFPMDGGRVFRAALSLVMSREKATRVAAGAGQMLAFAFGFFGLITGNLLLILIAVFIFMAAAAESNDVTLHSAVRNLRARDAIITSYESLAPDDTMTAASSALIRTTQHEFPVLGQDGHLLGVLGRDAIFRAVSQGHMGTSVTEAMTHDIPTVPLTAALDKVLDALHQRATPAVAVVDDDGRMIGYVTRENIGELMVMRTRK